MSIEKLQKGYILPGKVVVREVKKKEKVSSGGIIIPDVQKRQPQSEGIVVLVGDGTPKEKMEVEIGQTVIFPPMSGQKFYVDEVGEEEYLLIPQSSIIWRYWGESKE